MQSNDELINFTLNALFTSRDNLRKQLLETEKAIQYQQSQLNGNVVTKPVKETVPTLFSTKPAPSLGNLKGVIKGLFDDYKLPMKMNELQDRYKLKTDKDYNIRETVRGMNKKGELKIMKINNSNRNAYWVKSDWIEKGELKNEYKWDDFDNMYSPEDIKFI